MDWTKIYLDTFIPDLPKYWNSNFQAFQRYLDVFYDEDSGILIKPLETTGLVKGATGQFVTAVVDNLVIKNQFTNLYNNYTTIDSEFVTAYNGADVSTRIATGDTSTKLIWPYEPSTYSWIDVNKPYYKIGNDASYGFQNENLGQEFQLIFDTSVTTLAPYTILLESFLDASLADASIGIKSLKVDYADASAAWIKLITVAFDASYGPTWVVKEFGGNYLIEDSSL
jgi:hypothetical protein